MQLTLCTDKPNVWFENTKKYRKGMQLTLCTDKPNVWFENTKKYRKGMQLTLCTDKPNVWFENTKKYRKGLQLILCTDKPNVWFENTKKIEKRNETKFLIWKYKKLQICYWKNCLRICRQHSDTVLYKILCSVQCCFTSTETVQTIRDGEFRMATSTFTKLLSSVKQFFNKIIFSWEWPLLLPSCKIS